MIEKLSNLLLSSAWLIDERIGTLLYHQVLNGKLALPNKEEKATIMADRYHGLPAKFIGTYASSRSVASSSGKIVAIIPIVGTLTKRGEMCSYGMRDYMDEIAALNENPEISAIVLDTEGPGGSIDGLKEFGLAIAGSKKPIVAFADNCVASADYWAVSQSRFIIGNKDNKTFIGSIGVLCVHEYWGKYIEANIGQIKIIRAPQSKDKALDNPIEPLPAAVEAEIIGRLETACNEFFSVIKSGRGNRLKADEKVWGTGKMYDLTEAISLGLIDAEGTMIDAVEKAAALAEAMAPKPQGVSSPQGSTNQNNMTLKEAQKKMSSFFKPKGASAAKPAAAEPAAAEDTTPMWTKDLVFNTDGSGDGAFCLHPDTAGVDRKFETKTDNNTGNEPPTDPAITEDDNWSVVAEAAAPAAGTEEPAAVELTTISKLNAALKVANTELKTVRAELADLQAKVKANENKPAAGKTTPVSKGDHQLNGGKALQSWEKKAQMKVGAKEE